MKNVDLVYADLKVSLDELMIEVINPAKVRRSLMTFTGLTQKLTESMRKEYELITGSKWEPSQFKGWNPVTDLFKKLRREDYHEIPIVLDVLGIYTFTPETLSKEGVYIDGEFKLRSAYTYENQTMDQLPIKPKALVGSKQFDPDSVEFYFFIKPRTQAIRKALESAGSKGAGFSIYSLDSNNDVHDLCQKCFETLNEYYDFYTEQLSKNT